jgi:hypothetical protein
MAVMVRGEAWQPGDVGGESKPLFPTVAGASGSMLEMAG